MERRISTRGDRASPARFEHSTRIPWKSLMLQFGCAYANPRNFKKRFLEFLRTVLLYYPDARLEQASGGLRLKPPPAHVPGKRR
jgi:hypothetical protein